MQSVVTYQLPSPQEARLLRVAALEAAAFPSEYAQSVAWSGHRGAITLSALTPQANAFIESAPDLGLWLAERFGSFIPMQPADQDLCCRAGDRRHFTLGPVVLLKSGAGDWQQAEDPLWVRSRIESRLASDIAAFAAQWGIEDIPAPPTVIGPGRVLAIKTPVANAARETTWLAATDIRLLWGAELLGHWHIGKMAVAGFGRLWYTPPDIPTEVLMSVAEQLEALA